MELTVREWRVLAGLARRAANRAARSSGKLRSGYAEELEELAEKLRPWLNETTTTTRGGHDVGNND